MEWLQTPKKREYLKRNNLVEPYCYYVPRVVNPEYPVDEEIAVLAFVIEIMERANPGLNLMKVFWLCYDVLLNATEESIASFKERCPKVLSTFGAAEFAKLMHFISPPNLN